VTQEIHIPNPIEELEAVAQGHDLFRAPGGDLMFEEAREEARTTRWLPTGATEDWPPAETRQQITVRRLALYEAMQRLEKATTRAAMQPRWAEDLQEALENLEGALQRHVAEIETEGGLFSEVLARAPHLSHLVEDLRSEHQEMLQRCRSALRIIDGADTDAAELKSKVLAILSRIARHRQSGAELLYDAYNIDLAGGD